MSKASDAFLVYLGKFLDSEPSKRTLRRRAVLDFFRAQTGKTLYKGSLWKHIAGRSQPNAETTFVYMLYLAREGQLSPSKTKANLFDYARPELFLK